MKVKRLRSEITMPTISYYGDAGFDVYAEEDDFVYPGFTKQIKLGIAIEIEKDEVAIMSERSGQAIKSGITSIGNIIDSGYRGEISIIISNQGVENYAIKQGDKIGQIVVCKLGSRTIEEVKELSESERGSNAHFSSGQ
jgi:dUTP pyrophosphatase